MEIKNDGGQVFPQTVTVDLDGREHIAYPGIALRDHFAGQALVGLGTWMPLGFVNLDTDGACARRAEWAYAQADAMLAERKK